MKDEYKIELSFTMKEMEDYLLYKYPKNYHWSNNKDKKDMVVGSGTPITDIRAEFEKCFKEVLLRQRFR